MFFEVDFSIDPTIIKGATYESARQSGCSLVADELEYIARKLRKGFTDDNDYPVWRLNIKEQGVGICPRGWDTVDGGAGQW